MRPVVLTIPLLAWCSSVSASKDKSTSTSSTSSASSTSEASSDSEAAENGYDAIMCGENGYADGSGYSCKQYHSITPELWKNTYNRAIHQTVLMHGMPKGMASSASL